MPLQLLAAALLGVGAVTPVHAQRGDWQAPLPNYYDDICPDYALYSTYPQFVITSPAVTAFKDI